MSSQAAPARLQTVDIVERFESYDAYLTSLITPKDVQYLPDADTARRIVELGYLHGNDEVLRREEFDSCKADLAAAREAAANPRAQCLLGEGARLQGRPLLQALAERELPVRQGMLATIVFVRDRNTRGQEVSGYIDLGHRLAADDAGMAAVFAGEARLLPQPTDLSCFNWATNRLDSCSSRCFEVVPDPKAGLCFKCTLDHKVVVVDPSAASPGDYTTRTELETEECQQAVIFDHTLMRR